MWPWARSTGLTSAVPVLAVNRIMNGSEMYDHWMPCTREYCTFSLESHPYVSIQCLSSVQKLWCRHYNLADLLVTYPCLTRESLHHRAWALHKDHARWHSQICRNECERMQSVLCSVYDYPIPLRLLINTGMSQQQWMEVTLTVPAG